MIAASVVLLLLALLGAPLFAVIASSALLGFQREGIDLSVVAIEIYRVAEMPALYRAGGLNEKIAVGQK